MSYERQDYKREEQHHEKQSGTGSGLGGGSGMEGTGAGMGGSGAPMSASTGMGGTTTGMGGGSGMGGVAQNPATGETRAHDTRAGAASPGHQGWQDLKSKVPGTKEHEATRGGTNY